MLPIVGTIDFDPAIYYFAILPLIVTVTTNTVNMLGGLNGLETICPAIVMIGLMVLAGSHAVLLYAPLIVWLILAFLNFQGKLFVGNSGSFAIGITLASFAIMLDLKVDLIISLLPYIFNSVLILLTYFFSRTRAAVSFADGRLTSNHRRSLVTLVTYHRHLTERQVVAVVSLLFVASTSAALIIQMLSL
jgi:UDP-N-acetylmuramyl pentapeptide phosphotransferase/UDP-N-acetylglucosamine-1-phosphate transferase